MKIDQGRVALSLVWTVLLSLSWVEVLREFISDSTETSRGELYANAPHVFVGNSLDFPNEKISHRQRFVNI